MKKNSIKILTRTLLFLFFSCLSLQTLAQETPITETKSAFWSNVQFGGGFGLALGSGYSNISISPTAIYNVNQYVSFGAGVHYSFLKQSDFYTSHMYGGSVIALFNPIEEIQLSTELEQLRVNTDLEGSNSNSADFWNTGLFVGAGYRMDNVTIGARYNVLFNNDKGVYADALMPFIRIFF
jgi:hypothetical protein